MYSCHMFYGQVDICSYVSSSGDEDDEEDEAEVSAEDMEDDDGDEEEEEEELSDTSYDEGSYDGRQGKIVYTCKDDEAIGTVPGCEMYESTPTDQNIRPTYVCPRVVSYTTNMSPLARTNPSRCHYRQSFVVTVVVVVLVVVVTVLCHVLWNVCANE